MLDPSGGFLLGRRADRARVRWRKREEAAAILGPGGFAAGIVLRGHADALAAHQLSRERITWRQNWGQRRMRDLSAAPQMDGDCDNNRGDSDDTKRAAKRADIGRLAAHQWNICAEPGW
jgi:anti-sigma factor RsiW